MSKDANVKFIVVTGGVLSGLGKGVAAASIGLLLKHNLKVVPIKCDGYLNTDPGTMNPIEHGEVYVLDDGGEVDMDFGHYERFLDINARREWNITMGKVYQSILQKERQGFFLGKTVQLIPHVTDEIKNRIYRIAEKENAGLVLIEIGGTIGDMEIELFVESVRQIRHEVGYENIMFIHLTHIPIPSGVKEQKSKPTQQSVKTLNQAGIYPDIIIGRCEEYIAEHLKDKISLYCDVKHDCVISGVDVDPIYQLPLVFDKQGMSELLHKRLGIYSPPDMQHFTKLVNILEKNKKNPRVVKKVAICGKYIDLEDSYASISEALNHAAANLDCEIIEKFIDVTHISGEKIKEALTDIDAVIVPGGFGTRGFEGKIKFIQYVRENNIPFLGICLGMQLAVIEFARHICGIKDANSTEVADEGGDAKVALIDILPEQKKVTLKGDTMRKGGHNVEIKTGTRAYDLFGSTKIRRRFRHR
ncbi:MAG TPA: CTP synthase (glutamine hydrolyzing), partial [Spirochaetota bacterium]|nr:CTP synthase (glutamine hydrolyzing) [Spirochaetota bacterium]